MRTFVVILALALAAASANLIPQPGFPDGRIINGYEATKGEAPYIVSLQSTSSSHFCAGSLIDNVTILTAAHCLTNKEGQAVCGAHDRTNQQDVQIRKFTNAQYVIHEKYGGGVGPNDIGLILLNEEDAFDLNAVSRDGSNPVAAVGLPSKTFEGTGDGCLYGWGRDNSGLLPTNLQKLDANVIGYTECKNALPVTSSIAETNVCTHTSGKADGACNGDSGGPLVIKSEYVDTIIGIVSWGYTPCASTTYPSVYTGVASFLPWIAENRKAK
ncbi:lectizyme [Drosophila eugracilis]|uniref:lectizyme n=1 Tax=Drosophila eugracilis TaxID=29029 RepID=UPI001BDB16DD|nr:lectizyme [Drosophila eugracilis]